MKTLKCNLFLFFCFALAGLITRATASVTVRNKFDHVFRLFSLKKVKLLDSQISIIF